MAPRQVLDERGRGELSHGLAMAARSGRCGALALRERGTTGLDSAAQVSDGIGGRWMTRAGQLRQMGTLCGWWTSAMLWRNSCLPRRSNIFLCANAAAADQAHYPPCDVAAAATKLADPLSAASMWTYVLAVEAGAREWVHVRSPGGR